MNLVISSVFHKEMTKLAAKNPKLLQIGSHDEVY